MIKPLHTRRLPPAGFLLGLLLIAAAVSGQAPNQSAPLTVLSREGRKPLPVSDVQGRQMVGLDDLSNLFQLTVREDAAAKAVTVTYKAQTVVLTPDQSLASTSGGRLISLPAPLVRQGRRWLVPAEFIGRALAPIYDTRIEYRAASRLVIVGDVRVPRITAQFDDAGNALRVTFDINPKTAPTVTQEPNRLVLRVEADALDALLPPPPTQSGILTGIRAVEPNSIVMDLGPRFASFKTSQPVSSGAALVLAVELVATAPQTSATTPPPAAMPDAPAVPATPLPVFGAPRTAVRTIVIDAGHGGEEIGVRGTGGAQEKDVVLAVARRLRTSVETRLGIRVLMTRDSDGRLETDARVSMANNNKADLFLSLHANGSPRAATRGATIFSLGLDRAGEDVRRQSQADREVLPVYGGGTRELSLIEWEMAQAPHVEESSAFAGLIEQRLKEVPNLPSVSVVKAPMRSLAGANMPAILIEMGYLSNPDEEKLLGSAEFQNAIAIALTDAIVAYRDYLEKGTAVPAAR